MASTSDLLHDRIEALGLFSGSGIGAALTGSSEKEVDQLVCNDGVLDVERLAALALGAAEEEEVRRGGGANGGGGSGRAAAATALARLASALADAVDEAFGCGGDENDVKEIISCTERVRTACSALAASSKEVEACAREEIATHDALHALLSRLQCAGGENSNGNGAVTEKCAIGTTLSSIASCIQAQRLILLRRRRNGNGDGSAQGHGAAAAGGRQGGDTEAVRTREALKALLKLLHVDMSTVSDKTKNNVEGGGVAAIIAAGAELRKRKRSAAASGTAGTAGAGKTHRGKATGAVQCANGTSAALVDRACLGAVELERLRAIDALLRRDYTLRRDMLIKRLGVTLQSFLWSKRVKGTDKVQQCRTRCPRSPLHHYRHTDSYVHSLLFACAPPLCIDDDDDV